MVGSCEITESYELCKLYSRDSRYSEYASGSQYTNFFVTASMWLHMQDISMGQRKGISTQEALPSLIEKWKNILDKKGNGGAVLMDLSKAFDTLNHDLLIAKLDAYGFTRELLDKQLVENEGKHKLQWLE